MVFSQGRTDRFQGQAFRRTWGLFPAGGRGYHPWQAQKKSPASRRASCVRIPVVGRELMNGEGGELDPLLFIPLPVSGPVPPPGSRSRRSSPWRTTPGVRAVSLRPSPVPSRPDWSDSTRRAYSGQWRQFVARADDVGVPWLPAAPVDFAEYLTALMRRGAGITTVRQTGSVLSPGLRPAVRRPVLRTATSTLWASGSRANVRPDWGRVKPMKKLVINLYLSRV